METLALIEVLDRDGTWRPARRVTAWPVHVGRAVDCDVVLDDPHVAGHHARLELHDDGVRVATQGTLNGVRLGATRVVDGSGALPADGLLRVGTTLLRVRLAGAPLAPERPLAEEPSRHLQRGLWLAGLAAATGLWFGFTQWLMLPPGGSGLAQLGLYLGAPAVLLLWSGAWALLSKLFRHQPVYLAHLENALWWVLVAMVVYAVGGQLAFAFSAPALAALGGLLTAGALSWMLWRHLCLVLPTRRRSFALVVVAMVVVGEGLGVAERVRQQEPWIGDLYLGTLSLPAVRQVRAVPVDRFLGAASALKATLDAHAHATDDAQEDATDDDGS